MEAARLNNSSGSARQGRTPSQSAKRPPVCSPVSFGRTSVPRNQSGSEVVTTGAFVLKTEILKDSIGAGCADD